MSHLTPLSPMIASQTDQDLPRDTRTIGQSHRDSFPSQQRRVFVTSGDHSGGAPPVPIPNTEVKPSSADGTPSSRSGTSPFLVSHSGEPGARGRVGRRQTSFFVRFYQLLFDIYLRVQSVPRGAEESFDAPDF